MPPTVTSTNQRAFAAGQSVEVKCRTSGSRPTPSITWWKGNKQIAPHLSAILVSPSCSLSSSMCVVVADDDSPLEHVLLLPIPDPILYVCRSCHHLSLDPSLLVGSSLNLFIGAGVNRCADISLWDFG